MKERTSTTTSLDYCRVSSIIRTSCNCIFLVILLQDFFSISVMFLLVPELLQLY